MLDEPGTQIDTFEEVARRLETDDNPERFTEWRGKQVRRKPVEPGPEKPE